MDGQTQWNRFGWYLRVGARIARSRLGRPSPFFVSHLLTRRCFARCPTCIWRRSGGEEAGTAEIVDFYRRAARAGFFSTTFWGGEPLLRDDLPEVLRGTREAGFFVTLITNGFLLQRRVEEIHPYLDLLVVSLDRPSVRHDELRGVPGLFEAAVGGIEAVRRANPRVRIAVNTVVSRHTASDVEEMVRFAREHGLNVTFESVNSWDRGEGEIGGRTEVSDSEEIAEQIDTAAEAGAWSSDSTGRPHGENSGRLSEADESAAFSRILRMKKEGCPVNNSCTYLRMFVRQNLEYTCRVNEISLRLEPDGTVSNCMDPEKPLGNAFREPLEQILKGERLREARKFGRTCRRCVDSGVVESSLLWGGRPEVVANTLRLFLSDRNRPATAPREAGPTPPPQPPPPAPRSRRGQSGRRGWR